MNRIVREHYPVADLPADLREGFAPGEVVRVVVELRGALQAQPVSQPFSLEDLFAQARSSFATSRDIAEYVDAMRNEWAERR